jgi:hypothetical protein
MRLTVSRVCALFNARASMLQKNLADALPPHLYLVRRVHPRKRMRSRGITAQKKRATRGGIWACAVAGSGRGATRVAS